LNDFSCPIACTLDLIGDRWTLLIIRDMMFFGKQRFDQFLDSAEGISTNILASRLKSLEASGLVEKQPYSNHPRRMNYSLNRTGGKSTSNTRNDHSVGVKASAKHSKGVGFRV
jgi:DNA-binding HxlR family transcriptional regulator